MNLINNFIEEYLKISHINENNKPDDILKELSNFLEYTRIKDKNKMLDFKNSIKNNINEPLLICIKGSARSGKTSFINVILGNNIMPKKNKINIIIKHSNVSYIKIHTKDQVITQNIDMLDVINECEFVEVFLDNEILKQITIIECDLEYDNCNDYDICICINDKLDFIDCDFAILSKIDLLTQDELDVIKTQIQEKYTLIESSNIESLQKTPIMLTSIISQNNNIKETLENIIIKKAKAKKTAKIKNKMIALVQNSIKSYDELVDSYLELHNIINNQNFMQHISELQETIELNLKNTHNSFIKNLKEISKICYTNITSRKIDFIRQNRLLKMKKIDSKIQYTLNIDALQNELFDENNHYARNNRANIYQLSKVKDDTINQIKQYRNDFIGDIKIWQIKIHNFNKTSTFMTELHIDNLKFYALKIHENIINSFVLLSLDLILNITTQISKIESSFEIQRKLLLEFMINKINNELEKLSNKPSKNDLERIIENIINSYIFTNKFDSSFLQNISIEFESTKAIKCEQISKIILDIEILKANAQSLLSVINKGK